MTAIRKTVASGASRLLVAALFAALATPAGAQDQPAVSECDVDDTTPRELSQAVFSLSGALGDTVPADRMRALRNTVRQASQNEERGQNMDGRAFITGKALMLMLHDPEVAVMTTRGAVGFTSNPDAPLDMYVVIDSLFTKIEAGHPKCADEIQEWRFGQPWLTALNKATEALSQDQLDSAEALTRRAMLLERKSPYTHQLLASIYTRREDHAKALEAWKATMEAAGSDTSAREVRLQAMYYVGQINLDMAMQKQMDNANATADATEAARVYRQYLQEAPMHRDAAGARGNLAEALKILGDTAAIRGIYADLIANPGNYGPRDHLQAGVIAAQQENSDDAVILFGHVLDKSPYDRDALYNLALSQYSSKKYSDMPPIINRLVEVDPNNPANYELYQYAYLFMGESATDSTQKKAYQDSVTKYVGVVEVMKHKVTYFVFDRGEAATALSGRVENLAEAARSFTLEFEFLDSTGAVVATGSTQVQDVPPNDGKTFTVSVDKGGITAFKAKKIPTG